MQAIVATDANWGIGKDGELLFHIPEDMKFFREQTKGKIVLMGSKTLSTLPNGEPLADRLNLILTTKAPIIVSTPECYRGSKEAIDNVLKDLNSDDVYVIGGESIYNLYLPKCSKVYRTMLDTTLDSDKKFPVLYRNNFKYNKTINSGTFDNSNWSIEEWENSHTPIYTMTACTYINDKYVNGIVSTGEAYTDPYGKPRDDETLYNYANLLNPSSDAPKYETTEEYEEIGPGIWRYTYTITYKINNKVTVIFDTYGDSKTNAFNMNTISRNALTYIKNNVL